MHSVATAGIDTIKLYIDTGVNKRIIKVDRVFCLKKRRLALAHCRQTGTKKPGTKNVLCSCAKQPHAKLHADAITADTRIVGREVAPAYSQLTQGHLPAATMAEQTNIFLTDNRAT